jgi:hypothetical protein
MAEEYQMSDGHRSLRAAVHKKNALEQSALDVTTRCIEAQRRCAHTRRTREEKDLKAQLQRLHDEQKLLTEIDYTGRQYRREVDFKLCLCVDVCVPSVPVLEVVVNVSKCRLPPKK